MLREVLKELHQLQPKLTILLLPRPYSTYSHQNKAPHSSLTIFSIPNLPGARLPLQAEAGMYSFTHGLVTFTVDHL